MCNCAAVVLYYVSMVVCFLESEFNSLEALCQLRVQEKENCCIETSLLYSFKANFKNDLQEPLERNLSQDLLYSGQDVFFVVKNIMRGS